MAVELGPRPYWTQGLAGPVLESLPDAIVVTDAAGRMVYANSRLEALLGWSRNELVGRSLSMVVPAGLPGRGRDQVRPLLEACAPDLRGPLRVPALTAAGREIPVDLVVTPAPIQGAAPLFVAAIRDVSERVDLERHDLIIDQLLAIWAHGANEVPGRLVEVIGESLEWDVAALWAVEPGPTLRATDFWRRAGIAVSEFLVATESIRLADGTGLPGRALHAGTPVWLTDIATEPNFPRADAAATAGESSARCWVSLPLVERTRRSWRTSRT